MEKFAFIFSTRFWALVLIAIVGVLKAEGILDGEIANGLITILTGFTAIRTIDRFSETIN